MSDAPATYTLAEIDRLRAATRRLVRDRDYPQGESWMHGQRPPSEIAAEDEVRTYMANGTRPEDVEAEVARRDDLRFLKAFGFQSPRGAFALGRLMMHREARDV
jgi:hypothetical protein